MTLKPIKNTVWIPSLTFILGVGGIILLSLYIHNNKHQRLHTETQITAQSVQQRLQTWIDMRTAVVSHLANGRFDNIEDVQNRFEDRASSFINLYPGIQALNFIDLQWRINIVVPFEINAQALNKDLSQNPNDSVTQALGQAEQSGLLTRSNLINLLQGGMGFTTYQAMLTPEGDLLGFVNGVFRIDTLVKQTLLAISSSQRFHYRLLADDGKTAYGEDHSSQPWGSVQVPVRVVNRDWRLSLTPTQQYGSQFMSAEQTGLALIGVILVSLVALILRAFLDRQNNLKLSQDKYKLLVENQLDMVIQLNIKGDFLYVSPSYCATFDHTEAQILAGQFIPQVHPEDRAVTHRSMAKLNLSPHHSYHEQRLMTAQGWRWVAWTNTAVLGDNGSVMAITAVGRDITQRRELQEQLIQSQKMHAIGQLAGGIAHDFNNLLQTMLGNLQFLMEDLNPKGRSLEDFQQINLSIDRAVSLTKQLSVYSRHHVFQPKPIDLNRTIDKSLLMMRRMIGESIALEFLPTTNNIHVHADRAQLEQILLNLCINAKDAINDTGMIAISTSLRSFDTEYCRQYPDLLPGDYACICIEDDGQGMNAEVQQKIFEPFYSTKQLGAGTGLGLATVKQMLHQHNGLIQVESQSGLGSSFTFYLPLSSGSDNQEAKTGSEMPAGGRQTILIAEDDEAVRNLALRILQRSGYKVLSAQDGEEAVLMFRRLEKQIDLVILDLVMPKMGGKMASEAIRQIKPSIEILFASGFDPSRGQHLPLENSDFLMKPFAIHELLTKVGKLLDKPLVH